MRHPATVRPQVEALENREMPAGLQAYVAENNLYVLGTSNSDVITVAQNGTQISVTGAQIASPKGLVNAIDSASISKVIVYGNAGNDFINLSSVKNSAIVYGGAGDDMIRCGLGNTLTPRDGGFDLVFRPYVANSPVINGATASDVRQGIAPMCQTVGALAEAASQGHNFANDIQYLGSNIYLVKLYGLASQKVYFDGWTNTADAVEGSNGEFWVVLMQRARLQALGIDPTKSYTSAQWSAFNQQSGGKLYSIAESMYNFTGSYPMYSTAASANPQKLQANLAHGDFIMAQTAPASGSVSADGIIGNHAYAVTAIYYDAGVWKVRLYNPWGTDRENGKTMDSLDKSKITANDGYITLTWAQFTNSANFKWYYVSVKK